MKTLYISPSVGTNAGFYLLDIEQQVVIASHFCSNQYFAKGDLLDTREERKRALTKHYGTEVQCKFFNEQSEVSENVFFTQRRQLRKVIERLNY